MGGPQDAAGLPGGERQQAQHHARPEKAGGGRGRQAARRQGRRRVGELPPGRHGQARAGLRDAVFDKLAVDLLRGLGLRPHGAGADDGRVRRQAAGHVRDHVDHRRARRRSDARRVRDLRHDRRHDGGAGGGERLYQRTHTGEGQFVDVAMLDAALAFIPGPVSEYTVAGIEQGQIGNGSVSRKPTANRFRARDGYIVLAVLTDKQFVSLMRTIGRPDALDDPRFKDWAARTDNVAALREVIESALASDDPKSWEARLTAADVPSACIWKIEEIVEHPQLKHRDVLQTVDSRYGPMRLVGAGFG